MIFTSRVEAIGLRLMRGERGLASLVATLAVACLATPPCDPAADGGRGLVATLVVADAGDAGGGVACGGGGGKRSQASDRKKKKGRFLWNCLFFVVDRIG